MFYDVENPHPAPRGLLLSGMDIQHVDTLKGSLTLPPHTHTYSVQHVFLVGPLEFQFTIS